MEEDTIAMTFGQLEALLADVHDIHPTKRTAFQARLKNLHRLGFPVGFKTSKGKAALYDAGNVAMMALAVEMTQLGLAPERIVRVLYLNWYTVTVALRMAARWLLERPRGFDFSTNDEENDPSSMFVFFDPSALFHLTSDRPQLTPDIDGASETFFYGGMGVVRENIVKWTCGAVPRLSFINITAMLDNIAGEDADDPDYSLRYRKAFFGDVIRWSDDLEDRMDTEDEAVGYLLDFIRFCFDEAALDAMGPDKATLKIESITGQDELKVRKALEILAQERRNGEHPEA